jgi:two-component system NtrC family sensor kinase
LVQRLLAFSRQHPQEVKTVDINRLVQEMSELLHRTIGETVTIETVLASGLWKTAIDPNQLENAILNLAVNARDAMPGGGRLTIETSNAYLDEAYVQRAGGEFKSGQYVMVAISDTGVGMTSEVREKAFEPFFTTKPSGAGSGLGLSMVYGFVKQSDGHIQIYSEPGQGTSIKLYFPRLTNEAAFPSMDQTEAPALTRADKHYECILLVEDDPDVSRFVAEALAEFGYRVLHAGTAAEAVELLQKTPEIALLFTDVVLPGGMNGRELANMAAQLRPGLPVLFATGYTRNAIIHHGRLDANVELLVKPFTTEALARKVRQVLDATGDLYPSS